MAYLPGEQIILKEVSEILEIIRRDLPDKCKSDRDSDVDLSEYLVCQHMDRELVMDEIEDYMLIFHKRLSSGKGAGYIVPNRDSSIYLPSVKRFVIKKENMISRNLDSEDTVKSTVFTQRLLLILFDICYRQCPMTKRAIYYEDASLFEKPTNVDEPLEDIAAMIGCSLNSLFVVTGDPGVLIGDLRYTVIDIETKAKKLVDIGKLHIPHAIPDNIINVEGRLESPALFVLVVESDTVLQILLRDNFHKRFKCIVITGKGHADLATKQFLKKIQQDLKLPILGLMDCDIGGLKVLSEYKFGSKRMSYMDLAIDIKWLGVWPSDLDKYGVPAECRVKLTPKNSEKAKKLLEQDFMKDHKDWVEQVELMIKRNEKAKIQVFSTYERVSPETNYTYLTGVYLPHKLQELDLL